jgi:hypothetical protein
MQGENNNDGIECVYCQAAAYTMYPRSPIRVTHSLLITKEECRLLTQDESLLRGPQSFLRGRDLQKYQPFCSRSRWKPQCHGSCKGYPRRAVLGSMLRRKKVGETKRRGCLNTCRGSKVRGNDTVAYLLTVQAEPASIALFSAFRQEDHTQNTETSDNFFPSPGL